jgi:hypothetical protein
VIAGLAITPVRDQVSQIVYHRPFGSPGRFMVTVRSRLMAFIMPNGPSFPYLPGCVRTIRGRAHLRLLR